MFLFVLVDDDEEDDDDDDDEDDFGSSSLSDLKIFFHIGTNGETISLSAVDSGDNFFYHLSYIPF